VSPLNVDLRLLRFQVVHLARPDMGPKAYFGQPGAFTYFHTDGNGTVDSGHLNLAGYAEVIMLGPLSDDQKGDAMELLCGKSNRNILQGLPHDTRSVSTLLLVVHLA
jgi:hypothetical protein